MSVKRKYVFGPVPSRRIGLSLGVDLVGMKTCTQNCIYCQLGVDAETTLERRSYVCKDEVVREVLEAVGVGERPDYVTMSGSGEPTLNLDLGEIIDRVHEGCDVPVAVLTNGTLFWDEQVRSEVCRADLVMPSLDGCDEETFKRINRPDEGIDYSRFIEGLCAFGREYDGVFNLEVFILEGINSSDEHIEKFRGLIERIGPDKVQLNTAVRPTSVKGVGCACREVMERVKSKLGDIAEIVVDFDRVSDFRVQVSEDQILGTLRRRPCSVDDLCSSLGAGRDEVMGHVKDLCGRGEVRAEKRGDAVYYTV